MKPPALTALQHESQAGNTTGERRVLVIGLSPETNRSVVEPLRDVGVAAFGCTEPEVVTDRFDARDFELIVFGRGLIGPLSDRLKRDFIRQNPDIRFVDAIAPVAVKQTIAALAHDARRPRFVTDVQVTRDEAVAHVHATVLAPCRLVLTLYRAADGHMDDGEIMGAFEAPRGPFDRVIGAVRLDGANSLLITADNDEYHLHPFLGSA